MDWRYYATIIYVIFSDGVGRAGTYVLIDMVLNRMAKGCKEIDIAATLEHIRDQRSGMVQTRPQFEFCLMAVAEEVHAILKALLPWSGKNKIINIWTTKMNFEELGIFNNKLECRIYDCGRWFWNISQFIDISE